MPIAACRHITNLSWTDVTPGVTIHLRGDSHCRPFVVASETKIDPVTGHEAWQVMELGDPVVPGAEKPFTGVVLHLDKHAARQWHLPS